MKRIFLLIIIPLLGMAVAYADEYCGANVQWNLDKSTGILTIYGTGTTFDYEPSMSPFSKLDVTKVVVSKGVTSIGKNFFHECKFTAAEVASTVTAVGDAAFMDCKNLVSVSIPGRFQFFNDSIFKNCTSLKDVELPSALASLGDATFYNCISLESITLPTALRSIGTSAFEGCKGLASVTLPERFSTLNARAFYGCTKINDIIIPSSVGSIGNDAFGQCRFRSLAIKAELLPKVSNQTSSLETLAILKGTVEIPEAALSGCTNLRMLTIQECKAIKDRAFERCTRLDTIAIETETPPALGSDVFPVTLYDKTKVFVPEGKYDRYKIDDNWSKFKNLSDAIYKRCAVPVVQEVQGYYAKFRFTCATEGAEFHYTITCPDMTESVLSSSGALELERVYEISVYATAEGYLPSDIVKARVNMGRGSSNIWGLEDSDVNSDGVVNSADVVSVYNAIINGE